MDQLTLFPSEPGRRYIYRPWITGKDGQKRWAKWYGLKAFRIPVDD